MIPEMLKSHTHKRDPNSYSTLGPVYIVRIDLAPEFARGAYFHGMKGRILCHEVFFRMYLPQAWELYIIHCSLIV